MRWKGTAPLDSSCDERTTNLGPAATASAVAHRDESLCPGLCRRRRIVERRQQRRPSRSGRQLCNGPHLTSRRRRRIGFDELERRRAEYGGWFDIHHGAAARSVDRRQQQVRAVWRAAAWRATLEARPPCRPVQRAPEVSPATEPQWESPSRAQPISKSWRLDD